MTAEFAQEGFYIRPMTHADLPQVEQIDRLSFSMPWPENAFQIELSHTTLSRLWVVETDREGEKQIVGIIVVWLVMDEAHVGTIAVHPNYRRRGIGRMLLAHALLECLQGGARKAFLEVRSSNHAAQELYRLFGFETTNIRRQYYQDNHEDALLMTLEPLRAETLHALRHVAATHHG
ncbi:MAG: ribosomal protein S18-alanine N-acetyltransferase [Anaerolineae bacterium]|nr:ribosomal protein S18-alanine N-acetyltransferase [Anaerolineae bacterium]